MKNTVILKNGITFMSHQLTNLHSTTISVSFRIGSLYENESNSGITHLVEHLFFRKWDNLNQKDLYTKMMSLGAEIIGKTYTDYVCFSITVISDFFLKAFDLITKCLNNFYWDESCVIAEKKVVCKQIENEYLSYQEWINSHYFKDTSYQLPIMGTVESVKTLSIDHINSWKRTYFCCNNACVVITGNYTNDDLKIVQHKLSKINNINKSNKAVICYPKNFNNRNAGNRYSILTHDSEFTDINIFFDIDSKFDYESVRLLSSILGEGCGSLLSMSLRETLGFTDDVYTNLMSFYGFHRLSISFSVSNLNFFECLKSCFRIISKSKNCITSNDYLSSISFFTKNQIMDFDNQKELNFRYVLCDFALDSILSDPLELKEKYESISIKDLQTLASKIFSCDNISFLIQTDIDDNVVKNSLEKLLINL